jgi:hypothetical protein
MIEHALLLILAASLAVTYWRYRRYRRWYTDLRKQVGVLDHRLQSLVSLTEAVRWRHTMRTAPPPEFSAPLSTSNNPHAKGKAERLHRDKVRKCALCPFQVPEACPDCPFKEAPAPERKPAK